MIKYSVAHVNRARRSLALTTREHEQERKRIDRICAAILERGPHPNDHVDYTPPWAEADGHSHCRLCGLIVEADLRTHEEDNNNE